MSADLLERQVAPSLTYAMAVHRAAVAAGTVNILDVFDTVEWFRTGASWLAWRAFLAAMYALPMTQQEYDIFRKCTGRVNPPKREVKEVWVAAGRRARKTAIEALLAVYEGGYREHGPYLAPGERAMVQCTSDKKDNALTLHSFVVALLQSTGLRHLRGDEPSQETVALASNVDIVTKAATITSGRSRAIVLGLMDEVAFFPTKDSASPDVEILRGIRPAMANIPTGKIGGFSSPYAQRGVLYEKKEDLWGRDADDALFWMADTLTMHDTPTIRAFVLNEWRNDPIAAAAEVGSIEEGISFRPDVKGYISKEILQARIIVGREFLPPCDTSPIRPGTKAPPRFNYHAFVDPTGGTKDSFTLGIAHWDKARARVVQDYLREWTSPLSPKKVVRELSADVKRYGLGHVTGDAYAGEWPRDEFADHGIGYLVSEKTRSEIYKDFLPALNSPDTVELLDNAVQTRQFQTLERRVTPSGREIIDHPPNGSDDVVNSGAGAMELAYREGKFMTPPSPQERPATVEEVVAREVREMEDEATGRDTGIDAWHGRWQS